MMKYFFRPLIRHHQRGFDFLRAVLWTLGVTLCGQPALAASVSSGSLNGAKGLETMSHGLMDGHRMVFYGGCIIVGTVFGLMLYSVLRLRHAKGATSPPFHRNGLVEILWMVIPLIMVVLMIIPVAKVLYTSHGSHPSVRWAKVTGNSRGALSP